MKTQVTKSIVKTFTLPFIGKHERSGIIVLFNELSKDWLYKGICLQSDGRSSIKVGDTVYVPCETVELFEGNITLSN